MLFPVLGLIGVLFGGGLVMVLLQSVTGMPGPGPWRPSLDAYAAILGSPAFLRSLGFSLYIALAATLLSAVIAVLAALLLRESFAGRRLIGFLFQLNLTVPHVVGAIGILYLFSQSGSFARLAVEWGMITKPAEFPELVYDRNAWGIILHYVWKEVPFVGLVLLSQMQAIGHDYEAVARSLGASRWQTFRHVLLPMTAPGLIAASVIVFAFCFGAYEVPLLLGPNSPAALPVLAYRAYVDVDLAARPEAMAMAMVIALLSACLILIALRAARRALQR
jgi:putative spermidine/putrescine transport system permease protein